MHEPPVFKATAEFVLSLKMGPGVLPHPPDVTGCGLGSGGSKGDVRPTEYVAADLRAARVCPPALREVATKQSFQRIANERDSGPAPVRRLVNAES